MADLPETSNRLVPRDFGDLRGWIEALIQEGELHQVEGESKGLGALPVLAQHSRRPGGGGTRGVTADVGTSQLRQVLVVFPGSIGRFELCSYMHNEMVLSLTV